MAKKKEGATHRVKSPLKHNGENYAIGDEITLTDAEAQPLLEVETVEAIAQEKKAAPAS
jgi:hypothetical protein